uniref:Uncharacterized protein n=1 Tax=Opuntia streptacantha TaxID=393608 RepID=A0A7C8Z1H3_OPUST
MENIPALFINTCRGPDREFHASANRATESKDRRSSSITSMLRGRPFPDQSVCHFWINSYAALGFLTAMTTCAPDSANCLAISRPIPLVEPVTMQVRLLTGGNGIGFWR